MRTALRTPKTFGADPKLLIAAQPGTTNFYSAVYNVLDGDEKNPRIKLFETFGASVQALLSGDVDMVLIDAASGTRLRRRQPRQAQDRRRRRSAPRTSASSSSWAPTWSNLSTPPSRAMKEDGFVDHLNNRWFFLYDGVESRLGTGD